MSAPSGSAPAAGFEVARWVDWLGGFISRHPALWQKLGNWETKVLADELADTKVERPLYVTGLARSGTTILLEALARHPDTVTHRYKDFPPVFTPYWWNRLLERVPQREAPPAERSHQDGIIITPDSPEAFEEVIWMAFFDQLHDPQHSAVLDAATSHPAFEAFYRDHIRKLLKVRGGRRYLCKGNYNLTRLAYLHKLFPDARFVVPVREPAWHIASLMKQHRLFCAGERDNPRALEHMRRVGHFEFGLDRRPIHTGDGSAIAAIEALWEDGQEVEGWARYWALLHEHFAAQLEREPALRAAVLVVSYEALCEAPRPILARLFSHCALTAEDSLIDAEAGRIHFPGYYAPQFTDAERALIERLTRSAHARCAALLPEGDRPTASPAAQSRRA